MVPQPVRARFPGRSGVVQGGAVRGRRGLRVSRLGRGPLLIVCAAVVVIVGTTAPADAAERFRAGATKFFDSLFGKEAADQPMIEAPEPPPAEAVPELERLARLPRGAMPLPAATNAAPAATSKAATSAAPAKSAKGTKTATPAKSSSSMTGAAPARLPTWHETVAFGAALRIAMRTVAADAVDPTYVPKPVVAATPMPIRPAAVVVKPRSGSRPTPPLVVTRLTPSGMAPPRTRRFTKLREDIALTLGLYQRRPLNTAQHTPWEVMHGFIAFGIPTQLRVGGPAGDLVNAIGWSNMGGRCRGQVMLAASGDRLTALKGVGVQGHSAQYLAILAQCRVAANSPIVLGSRNFTVADLIEEEKLSCRPKTELTFALIALAHYLPTDASWKSRDGQSWSLPRLVEEEIVQPIRGAPCGGTHRLFGLAYGCQRRRRATGELDGVYLRADKFVRDYQHFTLTKLQNRDGSFSTEWFKYPADRRNDVDRKIQTTGHILEWLVASLDQEQLYDERVVAAAEFLCSALAREPSRQWKLGPLGHALHALNIYQERAWGIVLPGGIAAFHGPMKAEERSIIADRPEDEDDEGRLR